MRPWKKLNRRAHLELNTESHHEVREGLVSSSSHRLQREQKRETGRASCAVVDAVEYLRCLDRQYDGREDEEQGDETAKDRAGVSSEPR